MPSRKVFIVEDHPVFREGLVQVINSEGDLTVCGEAEDAEHALEAIPGLKPDLVLVDISLPGKSGLELIKDLRARNGGVKLLVLSMHDEALYADRVLRAGADGYIMKQEDPEEVVRAIRDVLATHLCQRRDHGRGSERGSSRWLRAEEPPAGATYGYGVRSAGISAGRGQDQPGDCPPVRSRAGTVSAQCTAIKRKLNLKSTNALIRYAVCWLEGGKV